MEDWRLEQWSFCTDCPARIDTGVLTADLGVGFIWGDRDSSFDMATSIDTAIATTKIDTAISQTAKDRAC